MKRPGKDEVMHHLVAALKAKTPKELGPFVSIEFYIDRAIDTLLSSLIKNGGFTTQERIDYDALVQERVNRILGRRGTFRQPPPRPKPFSLLRWLCLS